jgi:predicted nucleic acid-binding protein
VRALLDTSVLVSAFYADHQHHAQSLDLLLRFDKREACCAAHSLAEVYATLTGMPARSRVAGDLALLFLHDARERLTPIALDPAEYLETIRQVAAMSLVGGAVYDALIGQCALKAQAEIVYTWNTRHFERLPDPIARLVQRPDQPPPAA